ncbi:MAG: 50S ribosomal protein L21 [Endozoicomonadaceae bacterium]|nr:50S ribosomal protein L21 [Endozoicomonadaceae bacterium]
MFAIVRIGSKQYRAEEGGTLRIEKIDLEAGKTLDFDQVLMLANDQKVTVGSPTVKSAKIIAEIVGHGRAKKIHIIKFKRRKHHMKKMGHRQWYTDVKITAIQSQ